MSCFADGIKDISTFFSGFSASKNREEVNPILDSTIDTMQASSLESLTHIVREGEKLSSIASKYKDITYQEIAQANGIGDPNNIYVGQRITIPNQPSSSAKPPKTDPSFKPVDDSTSIGGSKGSGCECKPVIIIDPGHGDIFNKYLDPGAIAKANGVIYMEKDLALDIGLLLEKFLIQHENFKVFLTRKKDLDDRKRPRIIWRTNIFKKHKGDIFISLHLNASTNKKANGFSILTQKNSSNKYSKSLALTISKNYTLLRNRGIKSERSLGVLRRIENMGTQKASVLIELGFITNDVDRNTIIDKKNEIAKQISKGIVEYVEAHNSLYKK